LRWVTLLLLRPRFRRQDESDARRQVPGAAQHQRRHRHRRPRLRFRQQEAELEAELFRSVGPATAAHFHGPAEAGKNAGVAVAIPNATSSPVEGSATLTDAQAADLVAGKYYINIHTAANPGGEIRGQVTK
jgi:hypothetical protein